ncbi:MAG: histidinol-phosphate transaminase [Acidiferrobacterales bacterium]
MGISEKIARLIRPEIRRSSAYVVPDSKGLIKLDAMENPYGWPGDIKAAWLEVLQDVELNRYPDPEPEALKRRLRETMSIPSEMQLLLGNGSDELIQTILIALATGGSRVLAPVPTFVMYEVIARNLGIEFVGVPLCSDFSLDVPAMCAALERTQTAVTFIACPNNPTGNRFADADIETVVRHTSGLVIIDEAYFAFTDSNFMRFATRYDNVLVIRTLSKVGLAGLRLGFLMGPAAWLHEFEKVRLPYNINSLTQASVEFVLQHRHFLQQQVAQLRLERNRLWSALNELPGVRAWPSETNFIMCQVPDVDADRVAESLRVSGVLVKSLTGASPVLRDCIRITVGTCEENDALLDALRATV